MKELCPAATGGQDRCVSLPGTRTRPRTRLPNPLRKILMPPNVNAEAKVTRINTAPKEALSLMAHPNKLRPCANRTEPISHDATLCTRVGLGEPFQRNLSARVALIKGSGQTMFRCLSR
jgi:hypothetical protein